jgi:hypothetical protein
VTNKEQAWNDSCQLAQTKAIKKNKIEKFIAKTLEKVV